MRAEHSRAKRETRPFSEKKNSRAILYMFWACCSFSLREAEAWGCAGGVYVVVCSRSLGAEEYIYRSGEPFPIRGDKWL